MRIRAATARSHRREALRIGHCTRKERTAPTVWDTTMSARRGRVQRGDGKGPVIADRLVWLQDRDLILRGTENVYPAEIENVLCEHPAAVERAVIGIPRTDLGQEAAAVIVIGTAHLTPARPDPTGPPGE